MKVMLTGAKGMLAQDLGSTFLSRNLEVSPLSHAELNIAHIEGVRAAIAELKPEVVINCAGYNDVDGAESNRYQALLVNGLGVRNLALACSEARASLVHFSSDYVFDGKKDAPYTICDQPHPINAYGESKLLGEHYLFHLLGSFYLVRTSWLFGLQGNSFVDRMLELQGQGEVLRAVDDQRGCPTFTEDLSLAIADIIMSGCYGIYHVTNQGITTWYHFARAIFEKSGLEAEVVPMTSDEVCHPARRPQNSSLDPFPLKETIGYLLPRWEDALERYLAKRRGLR